MEGSALSDPKEVTALKSENKDLRKKVEDLEGALQGACNIIRVLRDKDSTLQEIIEEVSRGAA